MILRKRPIMPRSRGAGGSLLSSQGRRKRPEFLSYASIPKYSYAYLQTFGFLDGYRICFLTFCDLHVSGSMIIDLWDVFSETRCQWRLLYPETGRGLSSCIFRLLLNEARTSDNTRDKEVASNDYSLCPNIITISDWFLSYIKIVQ